jgi:hypothetical protein
MNPSEVEGLRGQCLRNLDFLTWGTLFLQVPIGRVWEPFVLHQCLPYLVGALVFMRPDTMLDLCGVLSLSFEEMGLVHDGKGMPKG